MKQVWKHSVLLILITSTLFSCEPELPDLSYPYSGTHTLTKYTVLFRSRNLLQYLDIPAGLIGSQIHLENGLLTYNESQAGYWVFGRTKTIADGNYVKSYFTEDENGFVRERFLGFEDPYSGSSVAYSRSGKIISWESSRFLNGGDVALTFNDWGMIAGTQWAQQANESTDEKEVADFAAKYTYYREYVIVNEALTSSCTDFDNCYFPDLIYFFAKGFVERFDSQFIPTNIVWQMAWESALLDYNLQGEEDAISIVELYGNTWKGETVHRWEFEVE